jgi:hypothetical protein
MIATHSVNCNPHYLTIGLLSKLQCDFFIHITTLASRRWWLRRVRVLDLLVFFTGNMPAYSPIKSFSCNGHPFIFFYSWWKRIKVKSVCLQLTNAFASLVKGYIKTEGDSKAKSLT